MKGCIILFGESFRINDGHARNRGLDESYDGQINAANSHMSFIRDLKNKNVDIDVYISSYQTKFTKDLIDIYKDVLIDSDFYEDLIGQGNLVHNTIHKIPNLAIYDFLFIMRIDLFIKNKFTEIFNPNWDKILWPSVCFKPHHKAGNHPRVNDMMVFFPNKYYTYLPKLYYCSTGHEQWEQFINDTDLKYDDLDTMLDSFHDSDSSKDYNPIYYIVNRPESEIHHNAGEVFNKFSFD